MLVEQRVNGLRGIVLQCKASTSGSDDQTRALLPIAPADHSSLDRDDIVGYNLGLGDCPLIATFLSEYICQDLACLVGRWISTSCVRNDKYRCSQFLVAHVVFGPLSLDKLDLCTRDKLARLTKSITMTQRKVDPLIL